jgi:signal transduction histidine kinase
LLSWSEEAMKQCSASFPQHYPLDQAGIWADCARFRRPVIHNDFQNESGRKGYPYGHSRVIRHASIPVLDQGKIVAILGAGNKKAPYDDSDTRHMALIGQEIWKIIIRRRCEKEILEAKEKSEQNEQMREIILKNLSHEFKTPLTNILEYTELAKKSLSDLTEEQQTYLNGLEQSCVQLNKVLDKLLSQQQAGQRKQKENH